MELNFNATKPPKCKNCGREKDRHKHVTMNCSFGRGSFPQFYSDRFYDPSVSTNRQDTESKKE